MPDLEIKVSAEETPPTPPTPAPPISNDSSTVPALEVGRLMEAMETVKTTLAEVKSTAESARNLAQMALDRPPTIIEATPEPEPVVKEVIAVPVELEPESATKPPAGKRSLLARIFLGA